MGIEDILSVISFAISLVGLVPLLMTKPKKKVKVLTLILAALITTSGIKVFRLCQHHQLIGRVENELVAKLAENKWTFDQIYEELHYVSYPVLSEVLFCAVEKGRIGDRIVEFRNNDGSLARAKVYYVRKVESEVR